MPRAFWTSWPKIFRHWARCVDFLDLRAVAHRVVVCARASHLVNLAAMLADFDTSAAKQLMFSLGFHTGRSSNVELERERAGRLAPLEPAQVPAYGFARARRQRSDIQIEVPDRDDDAEAVRDNVTSALKTASRDGILRGGADHVLPVTACASSTHGRPRRSVRSGDLLSGLIRIAEIGPECGSNMNALRVSFNGRMVSCRLADARLMSEPSGQIVHQHVHRGSR